MLDFKTQDVKYCQCCGQYLGSRKELGDAAFNPLKYCPICKKEVHREQKAAYRKRCKQVEQLNTLRQEQAEASALYEELHERRVYKGLQSKETRLLRERILQLEQCNRKLLRYIQTLEE